MPPALNLFAQGLGYAWLIWFIVLAVLGLRVVIRAWWGKP